MSHATLLAKKAWVLKIREVSGLEIFPEQDVHFRWWEISGGFFEGARAAKRFSSLLRGGGLRETKLL